MYTKYASMFLVTGVLFLAGCRSAELINPGKVTVRTTTQEQMEEAITKALHGRGWMVTEEEPGTKFATLHLRSHTAKIRIDYGAGWFDVSYVDSTNLEYHRDDGKEYIHENYNAWVQYLMRDIQVYAS